MKHASRNSYELLPEVEGALIEQVPDDTPFFVLGGIMTAALRDERTVIDFDGRQVVAPKEVAIPNRRKNGTRRDIDILIADTIERTTGRSVSGVASEAIDNELDVSVFGLDRHEDLRAKSRLMRQATEWLSSRTVDDDGVHRYELFPLSQEVKSASYTPWKLKYNSSSEGVSVLHPVGHALAYRMRSISGVRAKDKEKLSEMEHRLYEHPEARAAVNEGDFREWAIFASALSRLRKNQLVDMRQYYGLISGKTTKADLLVAQAKSSLLGAAESVDSIRKIGQSTTAQKLLKPFIGHH